MQSKNMIGVDHICQEGRVVVGYPELLLLILSLSRAWCDSVLQYSGDDSRDSRLILSRLLIILVTCIVYAPGGPESGRTLVTVCFYYLFCFIIILFIYLFSFIIYILIYNCVVAIKLCVVYIYMPYRLLIHKVGSRKQKQIIY